MQELFLALIVLGSPPAAASAEPPTTAALEDELTAQPQSAQEWREAVHAVLRGQATAEPVDQPQAVLKLLAMYQSLDDAQGLSDAERNRLHQKIRLRLLRLREEIPFEMQLRLAKIDAVEHRAEEEENPALLERIVVDRQVVDRWREVFAQQGVGGVGQLPAGVNVQNGGGASLDDGETLVDLIQTVISPDIWDVNGGPAAIVYFRPLKVLVISAPSELHHQTGELVDALRRAGN